MAAIASHRSPQSAQSNPRDFSILVYRIGQHLVMIQKAVPNAIPQEIEPLDAGRIALRVTMVVKSIFLISIGIVILTGIGAHAIRTTTEDQFIINLNGILFLLAGSLMMILAALNIVPQKIWLLILGMPTIIYLVYAMPLLLANVPHVVAALFFLKAVIYPLIVIMVVPTPKRR